MALARGLERFRDLLFVYNVGRLAHVRGIADEAPVREADDAGRVVRVRGQDAFVLNPKVIE